MMKLDIVEKLVLNILNKEKSMSAIFGNAKYPAAITASVFIELFLEEAISIDENKKVVIKNELNTDRMYLKSFYEAIQKEKPKKIKKWIETYGAGFSTKAVRSVAESVAQLLEDKKALEETKVRGIFKEKVRYTADQQIINSIIGEIKEQFLEDENLTAECVSITSLMNQCDLLNNYLAKDEKKAVRDKLKKIKKENMVIGIKELQDVIDEIEIAFMAAITAAAIH